MIFARFSLISTFQSQIDLAETFFLLSCKERKKKIISSYHFLRIPNSLNTTEAKTLKKKVDSIFSGVGT